jgi:hypothetical protein
MRDTSENGPPAEGFRPTPGMTKVLSPEIVQSMYFRKGRLHAIAQYTHPLDAHLFVVLIKLEEDKYVTWMYNADDGGFYGGHYFHRNEATGGGDPLKLAMSDFAQRIVR